MLADGRHRRRRIHTAPYGASDDAQIERNGDREHGSEDATARQPEAVSTDAGSSDAHICEFSVKSRNSTGPGSSNSLAATSPGEWPKGGMFDKPLPRSKPSQPAITIAAARPLQVAALYHGRTIVWCTGNAISTASGRSS